VLAVVLHFRGLLVYWSSEAIALEGKTLVLHDQTPIKFLLTAMGGEWNRTRDGEAALDSGVSERWSTAFVAANSLAWVTFGMASFCLFSGVFDPFDPATVRDLGLDGAL